MSENYIALTLTDGQKDFDIEQIILKNKNVVLLGVPGSGKTVLLEHFYEGHKDECELMRVKEFVKLPVLLKPSTKYFLLDGLDELRCASREKESIIYDIVAKLKEIEEKCNTLISCREMDWYGDNDDAALERCLTYPIKKVYITPLSEEQKKEFVSSYLGDSKKIKDFESKVFGNEGSRELLNVPQTLSMFLKLYKEHPENVPSRKIELYENIVRLSLEQKKAMLRDKPFNLSENEVFKYAGYIAYFYMMSDFDEISESSLLKISESPKFDNEKLKSVIELNIFEDKGIKKFSHRTIAEYLCAHFLFHQKIENDKLSEENILDWLLSADKKRIPSDLRGVYAWFCSLTQSEKCFSIDPYGQYLYGDNSLFEPEQKKRVVGAIGRYANQIKPYFLHFGESYRKKDFYESVLDDFLIGEFRNGLRNKNNYLLFLGVLMTDAEKPSSAILNFAKEVIAIPDLEYHFKEAFIDYIKNDTAYLQERLTEIVDGKIMDPEDLFLDRILSVLYPDVIKPSEIIDYLKKYKKIDCYRNQFSFLSKGNLSQDDLCNLVDLIYSCSDWGLDDNFYLRSAIESVVGKHLLILLENELPEVFLKRLASLAQKNFNFTYSAWSSITKELQEIDEKFKRDVYLNYLLNTIANDTSQKEICWKKKYYTQMFVSTILPNNCRDVYDILLESDKTNDFKLEVLFEMYNKIHSNKETTDSAEEIVSTYAKQYGVLERFKKGITYSPSPEIAEMMKKNQDKAHERKSKIKEMVDKNRETLEAMTAEEKRGLWGLLINCATFYVVSNESEVESRLGLCLENYQEMLVILKDKLFQDAKTRVYFEYTNIQSLAKDVPSGTRNVDCLYYAMLCLNGPQDYEKIQDEEFLEYLYLIALHESHVINSKNAKFLNWFDSEKLEESIKIVQKFILLLFEKEEDAFQKLSSFFEKMYGNSNEESKKREYLRKIQSVVYFTEEKLTKQEEIADKLMQVFDFQLDVDLLKSFKLNGILSAKRDSLVKFINKDASIDKVDVENLIEIFGYRWHSFSIKSIIEDHQLVFIESMMYYFDTDESMIFHSGFLSYKDEAAFFVNNVMLKQLDGVEGKKILDQLLVQCKSFLWKPRIQTRIAEIDEVLTDNLKTKKSIDEAKKRVMEIKEESKVSITINGDVKNSAIVGSANQSPVTISAENGIDFDKVLNVIDQITSNISNAGFSDDQKLTIQSDIQKIKEAVESKKSSTIRSLFNHVIEVCKGTTGNLIATGIIGLIETI
ncbi:MAG: hypothetical protein MJY87_03545 [Fibrobacter sp.]|nr:hypothetical protein [Fibrobacter sp.]